MSGEGAIRCGACTLICYAIGIGLGWVFSRVTVPHDELALDGAIVITVPLLLFVGEIVLEAVCDSQPSDARYIGYCTGCAVFTGSCISAFLGVIGVGIFLGAIGRAASQLDSPAGAIICGVLASIFVFASAITHVTTICCRKLTRKGDIERSIY